jgi:hypothetical protein
MVKELTWRDGAGAVVCSHDAGAQRVAEDVSPLQPDGTTTARAAAYGYDLADRLVSWTSPFADPDAGAAAAARLLVVDAIDENAARFYERHGFIRTPELPLRLHRRMNDVRASLKEQE